MERLFHSESDSITGPTFYPKEFFANKATAMEAMMRDGMSSEQAF